VANLNSEVKTMKESVTKFEAVENTRSAQILHFLEGQLKLALEFNHAQYALNRTIDLVTEHSTIIRNQETALKTLNSMAIFLSNRFNVQFIHHKDLPKVVELVLQVTNISIDKTNSSISTVELITRLLIQQQIDFIRAKNSQKSRHGEFI
jgi:hypothetical protein